MILVRSILSITGTPSNGSLPIGNGQGFTVNTLTAGTNITITNGPGTITIDASGGGGTPGGSTNEIQYNNAGAFGASANLRWIIADNRLLLGTENTADTNSRMVVIGKGISTQNTFVVHNQTGTNNALVVRDDTRVGIGTATPGRTLSVNGNTEFTNQTAQISVTAQGGSSTGLLCTTGGNGSVSTNIDLNSNSSNLNIKVTHNSYFGSLGKSGATLLDFTPNNSGSINQVNNNIRTLASGTAATPAYTWSFTNSGDTPTAANLLSSQRMKLTRESLMLGTDTEISSSILTLESTTKGFLPPRNADPATNIATPAEGLIAFDTTDKKLQVFDGTNWIDLH